MSELIRRAHSDHTIEILHPQAHANDQYPGFDDPVDTAILNVARDIPGSILVSGDGPLRRLANANGVEARPLNLARNLFTAPPNAAILAAAKQVINWRWARRIFWQLFALACAAALLWFFTSYEEVRNYIGVRRLYGILVASCIGLYFYRGWCRFSYGLFETAFGLAAVWYSLSHDIVAEGGHTVGAIKLGASIYVFIRGLDNAQKGLKNTTAGDKVDRICPP